MIRSLKSILAGLLISGLASLSLSATDIRSVDTEVWLHKNGNAVVYQRWDVTITGGTEWYIPIGNLGQRGIRNLSVFENDREFENEGRDWNSDRTLEQKRFRCGIVDKRNGVELCWGQGDPGDHVYDIIYIIDNLVQASSDGENDVFNWQFLNDEWTACPQHVSMIVHNEVDSTWVWRAGEEGDMGVWVFGCEADYSVDEGVVHIESTEPFDYGSSLIVMMRFDKGHFQPRTTEPRSFEQLQDNAFSGSDYFLPEEKEETSPGKFLLSLIAILAGVYGVFVLIPILLITCWRRWTGRRYKKSVFGARRITGWSRDVPLGGNLCAAYSLLVEGDELSGKESTFNRLIGAYFLRWVHQGLLESKKDPDNEGRVLLRFTFSDPDGPKTKDEQELKFYKAAVKAAGLNFVLEASEFSKWAKDHYSSVVYWPDESVRVGKRVWEPLSFEKRRELAQFRNYLKDFTLSKIRQVPEVSLWEEYLVYAELFGIADKVSKNLQKLYPEIYRKYESVSGSIHVFSAALLSAAKKEKSRMDWKNAGSSSSGSSSSSRTRYYGGGGHSSHHGGGGHHGGGHGGGSR